jgi:hypothetical protein
MKKLTTIFLITLLSALVSNAQKNTRDTTGDVCIPYPIIKSIQTDLLIGDSAKALLTIASTESSLLKRQVFDQMNAIDNYKVSEANLKVQIKNLTEQVSMYKGSYTTLENNFNILSKKYRKNRVKNTLWDILLIGGGIIVTGEMLHYRNLYIKQM